MKFIATFFIGWAIFFLGFVYIAANQYIVKDYGHIASGPVFAVGIAPLFLFWNFEQKLRQQLFAVWFLGLLTGLGSAIYLTYDLLPGAA